MAIINMRELVLEHIEEEMHEWCRQNPNASKAEHERQRARVFRSYLLAWVPGEDEDEDEDDEVEE